MVYKTKYNGDTNKINLCNQDYRQLCELWCCIKLYSQGVYLTMKIIV